MEWMVEGSIIAAMRHVKRRVRVQSIDHAYTLWHTIHSRGDRIHVKAQVASEALVGLEYEQRLSIPPTTLYQF